MTTIFTNIKISRIGLISVPRFLRTNTQPRNSQLPSHNLTTGQRFSQLMTFNQWPAIHLTISCHTTFKLHNYPVHILRNQYRRWTTQHNQYLKTNHLFSLTHLNLLHHVCISISVFFLSSLTLQSAPTNAHSHSQSPSLSTTPPSSTASSSSPKDHSSTPKSSLSHANPDKIKKRTLNTVAARRYRQKKVDQVVGLEAALQESEAEKDELRLRVARLEAEVDVLRGLVRK